MIFLSFLVSQNDQTLLRRLDNLFSVSIREFQKPGKSANRDLVVFGPHYLYILYWFPSVIILKSPTPVFFLHWLTLKSLIPGYFYYGIIYSDIDLFDKKKKQSFLNKNEKYVLHIFLCK